MPTPKQQLDKSSPRGGDPEALRRWRSIRVEDLHELNREEVQRLLEKVEASGPGSLTPGERSMLDRFASKQ